jgi:hypothetical protein
VTHAHRQYRVRFATRGATEVEGNVEFALTIPAPLPLHRIPVVAGSFVHPLKGATELRPLHVEGVDIEGALIEAFTDAGRWAALGRLLDIQFRTLPAGEWVTYGTGRCSGLDELDGHGKFRVEISDESWVSRRARMFEAADTGFVWPGGVRETWRGFKRAQRAGGGRIAQEGTLFQLRLSAGEFGSLEDVRGREVTGVLIGWVKDDRKPEPELQFTTTPTAGNFKHLRVWYPNENDVFRDWEVVSFGDDPTDPDQLFKNLEDPEILDTTNGGGTGGEQPLPEEDVGRQVRIKVWVLWEGAPFAIPKDVAGKTTYMHAPTSPPDSRLALHIGIGDPEHVWGSEPGPGEDPDSGAGWLHVADVTRRLWSLLDLRYDEANLTAIEADDTFPLVADRVDGIPRDPERWAEDNWWGPRRLLALKDAQGRRKLVDIRPLAEDADLSIYPVMDNTNSRDHRWRLVGRETVNSVVWEYLELKEPEEPYVTLEDVNGLDNLRHRDRALDPATGDTAELVGEREFRFRGHSMLTDPDAPEVRVLSALASGVGQPFTEPVREAYSQFVLTTFQDGPYKGTCELHGLDLAEDLSEGDFALVDHEQVKTANAGEGARLGRSLVLILSLTRHPAHADCEYLVIRPAPLWVCPDPEDPDTWWYSEPDQQSLLYVTWPTLPGPPSAIIVRAAKDEAGGDPVSMTLTLEADGEEVQDWTISDIPSDPQVYILSIPGAVQAAISDLSSLRTTLIRTADGITSGDDLRRLVISDLRIQAMTEAA